ncbi:MAG TPA: hypothetical protein DCS92_09480, partial [Gammaproteobacteria bacterium]|nr:hypothetical protein [Gammaproteobacteria bacterium]
QLHPDFFAGEMDSGLIAAAHAEGTGQPASASLQNNGVQASGSGYTWGVVMVILLLLGGGVFWYRKRLR